MLITLPRKDNIPSNLFRMPSSERDMIVSRAGSEAMTGTLWVVLSYTNLLLIQEDKGIEFRKKEVYVLNVMHIFDNSFHICKWKDEKSDAKCTMAGRLDVDLVLHYVESRDNSNHVSCI